MQIKGVEVLRGLNGDVRLVITIPEYLLEKASETALSVNEGLKKGNDYVLSVERMKKARSLNANAYCWVLLDKIAQRLGVSKDDIYKEIIRRVGVFEVMPVKNEAVERWVSNWEKKGLGWVCEVDKPCKTQGYTYCYCYYGSSVYDSKEMSRLVDEVVETAKSMGIETITPLELETLKERWDEQCNKST